MKHFSGGVSLLIAIVLCIGVGEIAIRTINPAPPVQFVRSQGNLNLFEHNGVPVWEEQSDNPIRYRSCATKPTANQVRIAIFGSSIFYGSSVPAEDNFSLALEGQLQERWNRPVCIVNYAQPAFAHQNKMAVAELQMGAFKPDIVLWEIWLNDYGRYVLLNDTAYNVGKLITDEDGFPFLLGLSGDTNKWLLSNSRLYEFAAFSLSEDRNRPKELDAWRTFSATHLADVPALMKTHGADVHFALCPVLHTPFQAQRETPRAEYVPVTDFLQQNQLPFVSLLDFFEGKTIEEVRIDTCCHYNSDGHAILANQFTEYFAKAYPTGP